MAEKWQKNRDHSQMFVNTACNLCKSNNYNHENQRNTYLTSPSKSTGGELFCTDSLSRSHR